MTAEPIAIVLIEDDPNIADLIDLYLRDAGFRVYQATNGPRGIEHISARDPKLVILDLGLDGDIDGFEVCRRLRDHSDVPVIMLTARDDESDRVLGLELGADDYVTKPFSPRELVARVRAILRRSEGLGREHGVFIVGQVELNSDRREVQVDGSTVALAAREFDLLKHLVENQGIALSRQQLLDAVWGADWVGDERTVDVHVRQLRRKLGDGLPLDTVWGFGYRLG